MPSKIFLQFGKDGKPTASLLGYMMSHPKRRDFAVILALVCRRALSRCRRSCSLWGRTLRPRAFGLPIVSHYVRFRATDCDSRYDIWRHHAFNLPQDYDRGFPCRNYCSPAVSRVFTCLSFKTFKFCSEKLHALHGCSRTDILSLHSAMFKSIFQSHLAVEVQTIPGGAGNYKELDAFQFAPAVFLK